MGVGGGTYCYQDLFERLVIAESGEIKTEKRHGYRQTFGNKFSKKRNILKGMIIKDDRNIQKFLQENFELSKTFEAGKAKIFVYHKLCNSLTSLYFERHDEDVKKIDAKRAFFMKIKSASKWVLACVGSHLIGKLVNKIPVPIIGNALSWIASLSISITTGVTIYKIYQLLPENLRNRISNFFNEKIIPCVPILDMAMGKLATIQSYLPSFIK